MIRFVDKEAAPKNDRKVTLFGGKSGGAMSDAVIVKKDDPSVNPQTRATGKGADRKRR